MKVICFDLDDTLYKEIDFLKSAFKEIVSYALRQSYNADFSFDAVYKGMLNAYYSNNDAFDYLIKVVGIDLDKLTLLAHYRNHNPEIALSDGADKLFNDIIEKGYVIGIITDGRSVQQRNKIRALGLANFVVDKNIIISEEFGTEKPALGNYQYFVELYPECNEFYYIADNPAKDFITPNSIGWKTICLIDNGQNIHKQDMKISESHRPDICVSSLRDVIDLL